MSTKEHKKKVFQKAIELLPKYKNIIIADVKDIAANYIQKIRHELNKLGSTDTLCGKTTVIQKAIDQYIKDNEKKLPKHLPKDKLKELSDSMPGIHLLIIFSNKDVGEVNGVLSKYQIEKQAKPGQLSPIEVIIPAGPTGMDSSQIDFFQALKIPTKVMRNQLEITSATKILVPGQKITLSEINLMKKFDIKPYKHTVKIRKMLLNGKVYGEEILKVTDDYMKVKLEQGIKNILGFSLGSGITTSASAPSVVANAFRNICALSLATNVLFDATKGMANAPAPQKEEKKKEEEKPKKEEPKKEEEPKPEEDDDDIDLGGLF